MWMTIDIYEKKNLPCPQFHGKWPFIRVLGMQEPASVLFSVLNGVSNVIGIQHYLHAVPSCAPMFNVAIMQAVVAANAWIWSAVYHSRDFVWTEILDYFCATSLVVFSLYVALHRLSYEATPKHQSRIRWVAAHVLLGFYITHICYLTFDKFDYGYNMKANIGIGLTNTAAWLWFWSQNRANSYVWKILYAVILTNLFLLFEILDFPPILWVFDAHSIWHMLTIPMPLMVFSFFKDDHIYLQQNFSSKEKVP